MALAEGGVEGLTSVISHATAPAFMLGAVAGFLSILINRAERVADMERASAANSGASPAELALLTERMHILHGAIYFAVLSALSTASLLVAAFVSSLIGLRHELGMAVLFTLALLLLMGSLVNLTRDVRLAMRALPQRAPGRPGGGTDR